MANQKAIWAITLHTECPKCREYFDIIHHNDDFWVDANFDACEQDTSATTDVEVVCPECGHEFECDFAY